MQDTNDLYVKLQVHLAAIVAIVAALLLFALLTNSNTASAQQAIASTVTPTPAASTPDFPPAPPKRTPPLGNLDSMLSQLAARVQDGYSTAHDAASQAPIHNADSIAVTFYFNGDTAPLLAFLRANGGDPRNIGEDYVEAYVPVTLLAEASERPNVVRVQAIEPPSPDRGSVTSQGVAAHAANAWHAAGYTGAGVKVGVIDSGFEGISALIGSELPSNVVARCYTDVGVFTSNLADCENGNDHGTAVSETLLDIAPDAALYIAMPESRGDMRSAVDWLISQDVDVINRSVSSTWDGPGDGTSPYSDSPLRSVDAAVSGGIMWANSAGSDAQSAWLGSFSNPDSDRWLNFDNGSADDELNGVYLRAGREFAAQLRWEGSWTAAESDLDLYLYKTDDLYLPVAYSNEDQLGRNGQIPSEGFSYTPTESGRYVLAVEYLSGDVPGWVQLLARKDHSLQYHTEGGGIRNPAESANHGMLAVGSSPYWDVNTIRASSNRGPTPDGRIKPDIVGATCAEVASRNPRLENGQKCWLGGTSGASPQVAGLAALVKQRFPHYTPAQIANYLKSNAERRGDAVPNNTWGYGFAKLPDPEATPLPTITHTPTHTATVTPVPTAVRGDLGNKVSALEELIRSLQSMMRVFESRFTRIESRLEALDGVSPPPTIITITPTPTDTPTATPTSVSGGVVPTPPTATPTPTLTPSPVPESTSIVSISAGLTHTCGLRADGTAVCWGSNYRGRSSPPSNETFTAISVGGNYSCGLRSDRSAVCWDFLSSAPGDEFLSISAGQDHACGLRVNGSARCWGDNEYDQSSPPGCETFTAISAGGWYTCGLRSDGAAVCWGSDVFGETSPPANETFTAISAGDHYACGLRADGAAVCWGGNSYGEPSSTEVFTSVSAGAYYACGLRADGSVRCWGSNEYGQSSPPSGETFVSISAGSNHACGLRADGAAVCWGWNEHGQSTPP